MQIDINCDMGESYGRFRIGNDLNILPYISSCNIACGMHGGDPSTVMDTIQQAVDMGKNIGAHPSLPDMMGFGRRSMKISHKELFDLVAFQVASIYTLADRAGAPLRHVKVHGALYNDASLNPAIARPVVEAIRYIDKNLVVFAPPGSEIEKTAVEMELAVCKEAFADRRYNDDLTLQCRSIKGAVIDDPEKASRQVLQLVKEEQVTTVSGKKASISAETICIHGDTPTALEIAQSISHLLNTEGIKIR